MYKYSFFPSSTTLEWSTSRCSWGHLTGRLQAWPVQCLLHVMPCFIFTRTFAPMYSTFCFLRSTTDTCWVPRLHFPTVRLYSIGGRHLTGRCRCRFSCNYKYYTWEENEEGIVTTHWPLHKVTDRCMSRLAFTPACLFRLTQTKKKDVKGAHNWTFDGMFDNHGSVRCCLGLFNDKFWNVIYEMKL